MAKSKTEPQTEDKAAKATGTERAPGIKVETRTEVQDFDAEAEAAVDPYGKKPERKTKTLEGGIKQTTYS